MLAFQARLFARQLDHFGRGDAGRFGIPLGGPLRGDVAIRTPVVLYVIHAPLGIPLRVEVFVLPTRLKARARFGAGRGIDAELQALGVDVIAQGLHVRELLIAEDAALRVAAVLPAVVDVDVCPAVLDKAGLTMASAAVRTLASLTRWRSSSNCSIPVAG